MNDINFQGINNVCVQKIKGHSSSGTLNLQAYRITGNLVNDNNGRHLDDFYKSLAKAGKEYEWKYTPRDSDINQFVFDISKLESPVYNIKPQICFMLNFKDLFLNNDKVLPIYSYISKAMSYIENYSDSFELKNAAKKINHIIFDAINDYLE